MKEWYIAKVKQQNERRVQSYLAQYGVEAYAPEIVVIKRRQRHLDYLFSGYVFVRADILSQEWNLVRWARGLNYYLPLERHPMPIADSKVEQIQSKVCEWNAGGSVTAFQAGDHVQIDYGSSTAIDAIFQRFIPAKQRCEVLVSLLQSSRRVVLDVSDLHGFVGRQRFATVE